MHPFAAGQIGGGVLVRAVGGLGIAPILGGQAFAIHNAGNAGSGGLKVTFFCLFAFVGIHAA